MIKEDINKLMEVFDFKKIVASPTTFSIRIEQSGDYLILSYNKSTNEYKCYTADGDLELISDNLDTMIDYILGY